MKYLSLVWVRYEDDMLTVFDKKESSEDFCDYNNWIYLILEKKTQ